MSFMYVSLMVIEKTMMQSGQWFLQIQLQELCTYPGGRLNKKDGLTRYGDSHVKDKTS